MLKRIVSLMMIGVILSVVVLSGCEDEVKTHRESETTTVTQDEVVVP